MSRVIDRDGDDPPLAVLQASFVDAYASVRNPAPAFPVRAAASCAASIWPTHR